MGLASGTKLGPYQIAVPLGAGGMGEVYRARDTRLDRSVAIKILPVHLADKVEAAERFEREARTISSLNHPNICQLHDVGQQDGVRYLVMELRRDGKEIVFDVLGNGKVMGAQVNGRGTRFEVGEVRVSFDVTNRPPNNAGSQWSLASDGQCLLAITTGETAALPLTVMQNWTAELKKK